MTLLKCWLFKTRKSIRSETRANETYLKIFRHEKVNLHVFFLSAERIIPSLLTSVS